VQQWKSRVVTKNSIYRFEKWHSICNRLYICTPKICIVVIVCDYCATMEVPSSDEELIHRFEKWHSICNRLYIYTPRFVHLYTKSRQHTSLHQAPTHQHIHQQPYIHVMHHTPLILIHTSVHQANRKKPLPPGGFPIYYVPSSRTVSKRTPIEEFVPGASRGFL